MHVVPRIMRQPEAFLDPQNAPKSLAAGALPQTPLGAYSAPPDPLAGFNQSINQSTFVKRHKSRANRRRVKKKARPSGYRMLWQKVPSLKLV